MHPAALGAPARGDRAARAHRHRRDGRLLSRHPLDPVLAGAPLAGAPGALVLVHGRDQDPTFMVEVAGRIGRDDLAWVLPVATDRSWYPGRYMAPTDEDRAAVADAVAAIGRAVAVATDAGIPQERVALVGFSQGACLLLELLRVAPRPYALAAVLTGARIGTPEELAAAADPDLRGLPALVTCSRTDAWIAAADATTAAGWLGGCGADVTLTLTAEAEHHVSDAEAAAVADRLPRFT